MNDITNINPLDFYVWGYLQEVNRQFFHPLGLSLNIIQENNIFIIDGVLDFRDKPGGLILNIKKQKKRHKQYLQNAQYVFEEKQRTCLLRMQYNNFYIEPLPVDPRKNN